MRKVATIIFILILSGRGTIAATAAPKTADKPWSMDDIVDRVITNENRANQQIKQYSPLVETYIQNLRPDKELGYAPAGDKYFLGRADFAKGVSLASLTDTSSKGKKIIGSVGNFFSFAMQFLPDGFLQMIFIDTNGFDKQHYRFDYVHREFLGEVRCLVFDVTPQDKSPLSATSPSSQLTTSHPLPPNSLPCHTSEDSPVSPLTATLTHLPASVALQTKDLRT